MRKAIALFLLSLLLPLRAAEWRDDIYSCAANLPDSQGWVRIKVADVPGTTVLIAMQNPARQAAFGVNVLDNPPSANLGDSATKSAIEQLMRALTYQFAGHSTVQIGATSWLQYPVSSTSGGLNARGIIRFTAANGRIYALSMLAGGGREPGADPEMQQAAASFRIFQTAPIAATKPAPVVAVQENNKPSVKKTEPAAPAETPAAPTEETDGPDYKRIAIFASGAVFVLFIFFRIISTGSRAKPRAVVKQEPKPEPKSEPKPKAK